MLTGGSRLIQPEALAGEDRRTLRDWLGTSGLLAHVPPEIMNMPWRQGMAEIDRGARSTPYSNLLPGAVRYGQYESQPVQERIMGGPTGPFRLGGTTLDVDPHVAWDPVGRHSMAAVLGSIAASGRWLNVPF